MPTDRSTSRWTREMRWHEIARAALILGIVPDYSQASMRRLSNSLNARVLSGAVKKRKSGNAQSAAAFYRTRNVM
jgi:hypothetical protein